MEEISRLSSTSRLVIDQEYYITIDRFDIDKGTLLCLGPDIRFYFLLLSCVLTCFLLGVPQQSKHNYLGKR